MTGEPSEHLRRAEWGNDDPRPMDREGLIRRVSAASLSLHVALENHEPGQVVQRIGAAIELLDEIVNDAQHDALEEHDRARLRAL